jgi:hypothetical protein
MRWNVRIETERDRRRGSDGESAWAIPCQCIPRSVRASHCSGGAAKSVI